MSDLKVGHQTKIVANNIKDALTDRFPDDTHSFPAGCMKGHAFVLTCRDGMRYFINVQPLTPT